MRFRLVLVSSLWVALAVLGACGKEIGDACVFPSDCSPNNDRDCDLASVDGYCTIQGCDVDTCPDEAVCVRFFTGSFSNKICDYSAGGPECSLDEMCAVSGRCVARSSEVRFCMRTCGGNGDCRGDSDGNGTDDYECRDFELMKAHGGEPVLGAGELVDDRSPRFCASAPPPA